jgi:pyridoxal phosphate enzyme (YggS family)
MDDKILTKFIIDNYYHILRKVQSDNLTIICKNQLLPPIEALLEIGHIHFGENYIQEAYTKWPNLKLKYPKLKLHLTGHLQTNKARQAVELFDIIETIYTPKLAQTLANEINIQQKHITGLVQVNIGEETQKHGISPIDASKFIEYCKDDLKLNIVGIMAILPLDETPAPYFALMKNIATRNNLPVLSMGMSNDYETALKFGANYIRIGSAIFQKNKK